MHNLLQVVEWSNQKFLGPSLQVYGLATPLTIIKIVPLPSEWRNVAKPQSFFMSQVTRKIIFYRKQALPVCYMT